jgi:RNA polymerase sigma-70 factor (ECF subfamily)
LGVTELVGRNAAVDEARRSDALLVRLCRSGDEAAWAALVRRFSDYVYAILTRGFGLDDAMAQDVFQEVFIRVFRRLDTLSEDSAVKPWIAQLTRRAAIDKLRTTRPAVDIGAVANAAAGDSGFELIEQAMSVRRALAELPEPYREVVERFFVRDQSYRTIAAELGLVPGTVASRISRGLSLLRAMLEDQDALSRYIRSRP